MSSCKNLIDEITDRENELYDLIYKLENDKENDHAKELNMAYKELEVLSLDYSLLINAI